MMKSVLCKLQMSSIMPSNASKNLFIGGFYDTSSVIKQKFQRVSGIICIIRFIFTRPN